MLNKKSPKRQALKDMVVSQRTFEILEESVESFQQIDEIITNGQVIVRRIIEVKRKKTKVF